VLYWLREIAGWSLVAVALVLARQALLFAMDTDAPKIVEASVIMFGAVGILRAGILLIRISTAARLCREPKERPD
jgi:hypothetical protein